MAKIIRDETSKTHLRNHGNPALALCGATIGINYSIADSDLECKECADTVLHAIELTTKAERREWRKL